MQFNNVDFVVDSKLTVDDFNSNMNNISEFGHIITTCQDLFSSHFRDSLVKFNRRQANVVAHALAIEVTLSASLAIYFNVRDCINSFIINEML